MPFRIESSTGSSGSVPTFTPKSIPFADNTGRLTEDNTALNWNDSTKLLTLAGELYSNVGIGLNVTTLAAWLTIKPAVSAQLAWTVLDTGGGIVAQMNGNGLLALGTTIQGGNSIDAASAIAIGSYAGTNAGPTGGLIVSGKAGFGTNSPTNELDITGDSSVSGNLTIGATSPSFSSIFQGLSVVAGGSQNAMVAFDNTAGFPSGNKLALLNDQFGLSVFTIGGSYIATFTDTSYGAVAGLGIGTNSISANLEVHGTFKYVDTNQGTNKVLTSDASGNATWQPNVTPGISTVNVGTGKAIDTLYQNTGTTTLIANISVNLPSGAEVYVLGSSNSNMLVSPQLSDLQAHILNNNSATIYSMGTTIVQPGWYYAVKTVAGSPAVDVWTEAF